MAAALKPATTLISSRIAGRIAGQRIGGEGRMTRRRFLGLGTLALAGLLGAERGAGQTAPGMLLSVPLELTGDWGASPPPAAAIVISRMREVSLSCVRLLSDRQPDRIRIEAHSSGPPAIWLHDDHSRTAWIIVDIGGRDWCKLTYQFGHELGHVLANSWGPKAKPRPPTQWLEESLVEAFSIRGLGLLAESWAANPPFAGDAPFAKAITDYRANVIAGYAKPGDPTPGDANYGTALAAWFRATRGALENAGGLAPVEGPAILAIVAEMESRAAVEDLGALNRWPGRSGVPIEDYLRLWKASCAEIGAPGRLPARLQALFQLA